MEYAEPETAWKACLDVIQNRISGQSYKTWFQPLRPVALSRTDDSVELTVELPSRFYYEWLEEQYRPLLQETASQVLGTNGSIEYQVANDEDRTSSGSEQSKDPGPESRAEPNPTTPPQDPSDHGEKDSPQTEPADQRASPVANPLAIPGLPRDQKMESQLDPAYSFERFIEGDCNQLARSAAWAIANQPGATRFNPFLVYGGVGLGKTHLIQAIGNHVQQTQENRHVLYVSSERFTTEFVQSIQNNRISEFSLFYRHIDLLIVDDIQFFEGKEKTQEEFFHIFNALHQSGRQIVLSADRPPRDIDGIEERLLSRFQWGLSSDVQPPELETRIAILQRKANDDGINLPHEVIEFIARNVKQNIRELEGSLIRLLAHATLHDREINLELAKEVLKDFIKEPKVNLTIEEIQRIVCNYYDISEDLVRARTRKREVVRARQVAMYFAKELTSNSLKTIGLHFGGRDHSTVIHANKAVADQMDTEPNFREEVEEIRRQINLQSRT